MSEDILRKGEPGTVTLGRKIDLLVVGAGSVHQNSNPFGSFNSCSISIAKLHDNLPLQDIDLSKTTKTCISAPWKDLPDLVCSEKIADNIRV